MKRMEKILIAVLSLIILICFVIAVQLVHANEQQAAKQAEASLPKFAVDQEESLKQTEKLPSVNTKESTKSTADTNVPSEKKSSVLHESSGVDRGKQVKDESILKQVAMMSLEEKVAQLFIVTPEALTSYAELSTAGLATEDALKALPVGGLIYFNNNLQDAQQISRMLAATQEYAKKNKGIPLFLSIDEEGGDIARIANSGQFDVPRVPDMSSIGGLNDPQAAYNAAATIATYLKNFGFNLNFAPVADLRQEPDNPAVGNRSFGSDPVLVGQMLTAAMSGFIDHGILPCIKHFPGHGAAFGDTHDGFSMTAKTLQELENYDLLPFEQGIKAGAAFVMVAHISLPNVSGDNTPASLSKVIITDLLRQKMAYDGIVITDALNMGAIQSNYDAGTAAVQVIEAGGDMLLMPADFHEAYDAIFQAVSSGSMSQARLDESVYRILRVKQNMLD